MTPELIDRALELSDTLMCQSIDSDLGNCDERNEPQPRWCVTCTAAWLAHALRAAMVESAATHTGWHDISTTPAPIDGSAFRVCGPALVHADFNPLGQMEACFDGERFIGAEWDGQHDTWRTRFIDGEFTDWQPFPLAPKGWEASTP